VCLIPEWSHTDPVLESPLAGDFSLSRDIASYVELIADINEERNRNPPTWRESSAENNSLFSKLWHIDIGMTSTKRNRDRHLDRPDSVATEDCKAVLRLGFDSYPFSTSSPRVSPRNRGAVTLCGYKVNDKGSEINESEGLTSKWLVKIAKYYNPF
jgi:hypothetical protein